jgi:hypothetical protein
MAKARNLLMLWVASWTAVPDLAAAQADGVAGPVIATIVALYSIPPLIGWLFALLSLRGEATVLRTLVGTAGCLVAAGGMMLLLVLLRHATPGALVAACLLPASCLIGHVARLRRSRRSKVAAPRPD